MRRSTFIIEMNSISPVYIVLTSILILSCQNTQTPLETDFGNLVGTTWQLESIDSLSGTMVRLDVADTVLLTINDTSHLAGSSRGRCSNTYGADVAHSGFASIHIGPIASSKINCPTSRYWDYIEILQKAESFYRTPGTLAFYCEGSELRLSLRLVQPRSALQLTRKTTSLGSKAK
jgi:hypothetical protein